MSNNQSRPDGSDNQYRRTGRSTGYHQQHPHRSSTAAYGRGVSTGAVIEVDPSLFSNRSVKKPQRRHQTRVNPPPVSHPVPNKQNGLYVHPRSQAPGDPSKASAFRFGSLGPDLRKEIPAPPNVDKQKRAQVTAWVPKKDLRNKAADKQLVKKEGNSSSNEKTDVVQGHGFLTPMGAQIHTQLGHVDVGADEEEAKQRKFKGILNKLTPQNFEKLLEQVESINIDNAATLIALVSQIFDKALMEPTFVEMYADLCFHLSRALPDFNENGEKITFKRLLLSKCREEFERGEKEEEGVAEEGQVEQTEEEREEKRLNSRRRMLCNIGLMGELYKKKIIPEKIMHHCIQELLRYDQDPHEDNIEALCKLMSTIGRVIDHRKAKGHMDAYFKKMKMLSSKQELSSRVRFMLINAMDLRKNKWQERMKLEGPIPDTAGYKT